jgi:hypothetical protein
MPYKDKDKYNEYMKNYKRCRRFGLPLNNNSNELDNKYKNGKYIYD